MTDLLIDLFDRIARAVLIGNPGAWDDVHDTYPDADD